MREPYNLSSPLARTTRLLVSSNVFTTFARYAHVVDSLLRNGPV